MGEKTEWRTIRIPEPVRDDLADEKDDETWGELFTRLLAATGSSDSEGRLETGVDRELEKMNERIGHIPERVADRVEERLQ